jgi:DNA-binding transcriptional LysR family regulator
MLDLTRLHLLRELARRGTMIAVADAAGLTSSAVSQQLATLEREAGVALLEQIGRRVRLTAEGTRLVAHAETILQAVDAAERDLHNAKDAPGGELEVACFASYAKTHLLAAIARACARHPGMRVAVHELETPDALDAVGDGRCHLAICFAYNLVPRAEVAGLATRLLLEEPVHVAMPASMAKSTSTIALGRLEHEDWIVGSRQSDDHRLAERACAAAGFAPRITHTIDDYDLLLRMVAGGFGVGFVPELGVRSAATKGIAIRTPRGMPLTRRVHAVTRRALAASPLVAALLAELARPRG